MVLKLSVYVSIFIMAQGDNSHLIDSQQSLGCKKINIPFPFLRKLEIIDIFSMCSFENDLS